MTRVQASVAILKVVGLAFVVVFTVAYWGVVGR